MQERKCVMCQLIAICCSFIQLFNLKKALQRKADCHKKLKLIYKITNRIAKQLARMICKTIVTDSRI